MAEANTAQQAGNQQAGNQYGIRPTSDGVFDILQRYVAVARDRVISQGPDGSVSHPLGVDDPDEAERQRRAETARGSLVSFLGEERAKSYDASELAQMLGVFKSPFGGTKFRMAGQTDVNVKGDGSMDMRVNMATGGTELAVRLVMDGAEAQGWKSIKYSGSSRLGEALWWGAWQRGLDRLSDDDMHNIAFKRAQARYQRSKGEEPTDDFDLKDITFLPIQGYEPTSEMRNQASELLGQQMERVGINWEAVSKLAQAHVEGVPVRPDADDSDPSANQLWWESVYQGLRGMDRQQLADFYRDHAAGTRDITDLALVKVETYDEENNPVAFQPSEDMAERARDMLMSRMRAQGLDPAEIESAAPDNDGPDPEGPNNEGPNNEGPDNEGPDGAVPGGGVGEVRGDETNELDFRRIVRPDEEAVQEAAIRLDGWRRDRAEATRRAAETPGDPMEGRLTTPPADANLHTGGFQRSPGAALARPANDTRPAGLAPQRRPDRGTPAPASPASPEAGADTAPDLAKPGAGAAGGTKPATTRPDPNSRRRPQ